MSINILSPTLEDYLEAIFQISAMNKVARSMEIADKLNVKRSSVTVALRSLAEKGLINYEARSFVTLTEEGLGTARCIDRRHHVLKEFFTGILGLSEEDADKTACSMEHGMSSEVCRKMGALMDAMQKECSASAIIRETMEECASRINCSSDCAYSSKKTRDSDTEDKKENLNDLSPGDRGIVTEVKGSGSLKKRLLDMGIVRNQAIHVVRAAPLDDPIEVVVRNTHLSLRREEASMIYVNRKV